MIFNETHYRSDETKIDLKNGNEILRLAVRAVIFNEDKILMAHLRKTDEYKFPGGGRKENETAEEALKREVLEEVGYNVIEIGEKIGIITEYDTAKEGNEYYFKMISEYYIAKVDYVQLEQNLEENEKELLFEPCWVDIKEAYNTNKQRINERKEKTPGISREKIALEKIIERYIK